MSIWFDRAQRSVVAGCTECGCRDVFTSQAAADSWAVAHAHAAGHVGILASMARRHARSR